MGILINKSKLKAAAGSMHQFCGAVRGVFIRPVTDDVVEAATVFLYEHVAREVFGNRFATELRREARLHYRSSPATTVEQRVDRLARNVDVLRRHADRIGPAGSAHEQYTRHVHNVIRALLIEANAPHNDPELIKGTFSRFESVIRRVKDHLVGIKRQSKYVMR
ncbi:MAG: hypothetical protein GY715_03235 [Planctomycetes bacterium]|nr:hypothetical protein [Planctomycetota bacterium]